MGREVGKKAGAGRYAFRAGQDRPLTDSFARSGALLYKQFSRKLRSLSCVSLKSGQRKRHYLATPLEPTVFTECSFTREESQN
jgi:hypothetical protein